MSRFLSLAAVAMLASLAYGAGPSQGPMQGPVQGPVQAPSYKVVAESLPVCCDPCIKYIHHRPRCEPCGAHYQTTLLVKDNCNCCYVEVPMCLPECCQGQPSVCHKGLHVVDYTWNSGYKVRVILTKRGKVFVHYNVV